MKWKWCLCLLTALSTCYSIPSDSQTMQRILNDSSSPFWRCKTIAVEQKLVANPYWRFPLWNILKDSFPHAFSERTRKQVDPEHIILVRNPLIVSDAFLNSYLQTLTSILPQELRRKTDRTVLISALHRTLQSYGYSIKDKTQLVGYSHNLMGFLGYVSLLNEPFLEACRPTGITESINPQWQRSMQGQIIDNSRQWIYLEFLPNGQPSRLVRTLENGWEVQDVISNQIYHLFNSRGVRINIEEIQIKVQANQKLPLFLDLHLRMP